MAPMLSSLCRWVHGFPLVHLTGNPVIKILFGAIQIESAGRNSSNYIIFPAL